ncbi:hypothetical protein K439DRAFT_1625599, partial [Ramaria rubella]
MYMLTLLFIELVRVSHILLRVSTVLDRVNFHPLCSERPGGVAVSVTNGVERVNSWPLQYPRPCKKHNPPIGTVRPSTCASSSSTFRISYSGDVVVEDYEGEDVCGGEGGRVSGYGGTTEYDDDDPTAWARCTTRLHFVLARLSAIRRINVRSTVVRLMGAAVAFPDENSETIYGDRQQCDAGLDKNPMASINLASILTSSEALNSHLQTRPDLPTVNLGLDQVELQSRCLVNGQGGATSADAGKANYPLAQAHVDAPTLAHSIAALNTSTTFSPLQPLHDTDVAGYLRHAHEQTLMCTIEEGRRETEAEFYHVLEERVRRDWEARKKRVFEELGGRGFAVEAGRSTADLRQRDTMYSSVSHIHPLELAKGDLTFSQQLSSNFTLSLQMHEKMMAYDRVVSELSSARIGDVSFPVVYHLLDATRSTGEEPPALPRQSHNGAHLLNTPLCERKYARAYLADENSREAANLRIQIVQGAKEALEEQYWDVIERTIASNPAQAALGGDPSAANRVRAYLAVQFYRSGQWEDRLEILNGRPIWAQLFYLLRTGRVEDAVEEAVRNKSVLDSRQRDFVAQFRKWALSDEGSGVNRATFRTHLEHSPTVDPFKGVLFKLMGRLEPDKRNVPYVTATTEDWLWFQLAM